MSESEEQTVCPKCGHRHAAAFGGICIGCPCTEGGWQDGTVRVASSAAVPGEEPKP